MLPFYVFPRNKFYYHFLAAVGMGADGAANLSGWMKAMKFLKFLRYFKKYTRPTPWSWITTNHIWQQQDWIFVRRMELLFCLFHRIRATKCNCLTERFSGRSSSFSMQHAGCIYHKMLQELLACTTKKRSGTNPKERFDFKHSI